METLITGWSDAALLQKSVASGSRGAVGRERAGLGELSAAGDQTDDEKKFCCADGKIAGSLIQSVVGRQTSDWFGGRVGGATGCSRDDGRDKLGPESS